MYSTVIIFNEAITVNQGASRKTQALPVEREKQPRRGQRERGGGVVGREDDEGEGAGRREGE